MNNGELALTIVGIALQVCLFLQLIRLKSYRQFPVFYSYVGFSVVSAIMALATSAHGHVYFYVYWISEAIYVLLTFLVLQEAFRSVFRNFYALRWFKLSLPGVGILILIVALLRTAFFRPPDANPLTVTLISLEIAVGFLQFGIFCLFVLLVRFFHMRWRQQAFGIVLGFGIVAAGPLVAFLLRSEFGTKFNPVVRITPPIAYIMGVAIWLATFLRRVPSPPQGWDSGLTPEQMIAELRRHTRAVKGILGR
jgi:hypothetical protein